MSQTGKCEGCIWLELSEKLLHLKGATLLGLILCIARGDFCPPPSAGRHGAVHIACSRTSLDGWCRVKQLHYGFTLRSIHCHWRGQVLVRLFAFETIPLINPECTRKCDIYLGTFTTLIWQFMFFGFLSKVLVGNEQLAREKICGRKCFCLSPSHCFGSIWATAVSLDNIIEDKKKNGVYSIT